MWWNSQKIEKDWRRRVEEDLEEKKRKEEILTKVWVFPPWMYRSKRKSHSISVKSVNFLYMVSLFIGLNPN